RPGRAPPRHTGPYSSSSHASALPLASHSRQSDTWAEVQAWFHSSLCRGVCAGMEYLWASIICELGAYLSRPVLSPSVKKTSLRHVHVNSASKALASFKSTVSKPSVNQL